MVGDVVPVHEVPPVGRRERKKRATRLALKAAALDLVVERGFAHVTVEDIADAVDVSVRTFFNYFASKEAAVVGEDPELVAAMKVELVAAPADLGPLEALRTVLLRRVQSIEEDIDLSGEGHGAWQRRFAVARAQPEVLFAFTRYLTGLEQALADALVERLGGDERSRMYASLVTTTAIGAIRVAGLCSDGEGDGSSLLGMATKAFDLLECGLGYRPGRPAAAKRSARAIGGP